MATKNFFLRSKILALATVLLPVSYIIPGIFAYYDEFFVFVCAFFHLTTSRKIFSRRDRWIFFNIIITYLIGLISNLQSNLIVSPPPIIIDMLTMYKQFLVFVLLRKVLSEHERHVFVNFLTPLSKFYIILTFILALLSQFVNIGMTFDERYGIKAFSFVFGNPSVFGISVIACLLIISASTLPNRKFVLYVLLSFVTLLQTTKGVIYSFITVYFIIFFIDNKANIKIRHLIIFATAICLISTYQINTYIADHNSPRMHLLLNSFKVAYDYAPLGSGFATYGGEQAKQHYSPLYVKYGFPYVYGLGMGRHNGNHGNFLNDDYLAMIIAQTGYFGTLIYTIILFQLFQILNKDKHSPIRYKTIAMAAFSMLVVCSIGTGIIKSTNGVFLFALLAILPTTESMPNIRRHLDEQ